MPSTPEQLPCPGRRQAVQSLLGLGGLLSVQGAHAQLASIGYSRDLRVIQSSEFVASRAIVQALRQRFPGLQAETELAAFEPRKAQALYVALGPAALKRALAAELKAPLMSVFTSGQTWRQLTGADVRDRPPGSSALYAEASPAAQMQLAATLFERRVAVGVMLSEASAHLERPLRLAAQAQGVDLLVERGVGASELVRALNRMPHVQALLAVPDATLYTAESLRAVLESTYRRGMPVLGFSAATVAAGTLGTALSTVDDVVADLAELIDSLPAQAMPPLPEPRSPRYWRVSFNEHVARSLGIQLSDKVLSLGNQAAGKRA
jgi:putative tryptophan/tyrosine transport system substrate-binding protein